MREGLVSGGVSIFQFARSPLAITAAVILAAAVMTSKYLSHDFAHFVGMGGLVVLLTEFLRHGARFKVTIGLSWVRGLLMVVGSVAVIAVANRLGHLSRGIASFAAVGVIMTASLICISRRVYELLGDRHPAPIAAITVLAISVLWEFVVQPAITVYGGPARGSIEWPQVLADFSAVLLAYWPLRNLKTHATADESPL